MEVANVVHPVLNMEAHAEIFRLGTILFVGHLVFSNLIHSVFHTILDVLISLLLVLVRLVLVLSFEFVHIFNSLESKNLRSIVIVTSL